MDSHAGARRDAETSAYPPLASGIFKVSYVTPTARHRRRPPVSPGFPHYAFYLYFVLSILGHVWVRVTWQPRRRSGVPSPRGSLTPPARPTSVPKPRNINPLSTYVVLSSCFIYTTFHNISLHEPFKAWL